MKPYGKVLTEPEHKTALERGREGGLRALDWLAEVDPEAQRIRNAIRAGVEPTPTPEDILIDKHNAAAEFRPLHDRIVDLKNQDWYRRNKPKG